MKKVLFLALTIIGFSIVSNAQCKPSDVINVNGSGEVVLYADYDNIVRVASTCCQEMRLVGTGVTVKIINNNTYSVRVSNAGVKTATLTVSCLMLGKKSANLATYKCTIKPAPVPLLYLDSNDPKSMIGRDGVHDLQVKMPVDLPFNAEVTNWNVMLENGASFTGVGSDLSAAANTAIASAPARSSITVNVTYNQSVNGISSTKNISGVYYVE
jgi:hypothetical protein